MKKITRTIDGYYVDIKFYDCKTDQIKEGYHFIPFKKYNNECKAFILDMIESYYTIKRENVTILKVDFTLQHTVSLSIPLDYSSIRRYSQDAV